MKDEVRTDNDWYAWNYWQTVQAQLWQLRVPGPPLEFPGEHGILEDTYASMPRFEQKRDLSHCNFFVVSRISQRAG